MWWGRGYIRWILYPRKLHSNFHVQSHLNLMNLFVKMGFLFLLWNGDATFKIVLDGKRKKGF